MPNQQIEIIFLEEQFVSEKFGYGGTIDMYCILNGKLTLVDFKTGKDIYIGYLYQLAGYLQLLREHKYKVERCICLNIPKRTQFKIFLKCLDIKILQSVEATAKTGKIEVGLKRRDLITNIRKEELGSGGINVGI